MEKIPSWPPHRWTNEEEEEGATSFVTEPQVITRQFPFFFSSDTRFLTKLATFPPKSRHFHHQQRVRTLHTHTDTRTPNQSGSSVDMAKRRGARKNKHNAIFRDAFREKFQRGKMAPKLATFRPKTPATDGPRRALHTGTTHEPERTGFLPFLKMNSSLYRRLPTLKIFNLMEMARWSWAEEQGCHLGLQMSAQGRMTSLR